MKRVIINNYSDKNLMALPQGTVQIAGNNNEVLTGVPVHEGARYVSIKGRLIIVKMGPFLSKTDGKTPLTSLTITPAMTMLSKNNGPFAAKTNVDNAVYDVHGFYDVKLDAADTTISDVSLSSDNTLQIKIDHPDALPVFKTVLVAVEPF